MVRTGTVTRRREQNELAAALARGPVEVLDFLLPLWAGSQLGASAAAVGALTALETLVSFAVRPVAGVLADRFDRGRLAAFGAVLYGLSFAGYAAAPGIGLAYAAAVLGGAGGALFWVALRARVGEGLADDSGVFSKLFAAEGAGTWIAFVVAMTLVSRIDYQGVFWLGAAACVVAAVALLVPSGAPPAQTEQAPRFSDLGRRLRSVLGLVVLTSLAEAGVALLLLLHLQRGHQLELGEIALVFLPGFIVYSTLPDFLHGIVRRLGRTWVLSVALAFSAAFAAGLSFAPNPWVIAGMWVLSAVAFAAAIPVQQSIVAEAAGVSLGKGMGIYESAMLLGATIGTFSAGLLYSAGDGWRVACLGAAALLLAGAVLVRPAIRTVGVVEHPAPPKEPERPEPEPEPEPERQGSDLRNWYAHVGAFVVGQLVLAVLGYSWPLEALFGEGHDGNWYWNSSGHLLLNVSRIWCFAFVIDTVWTWGGVVLRGRKGGS
ncbi:MFS transporter [Prauserella cavernicola]|uniref:MFS transporter n=1 Tax=Prauserella cavernicola TaxID=2800127 RepID=A0A934QRM0_9PSEU|nr:MFS transporter [Prauserella cavernicola]MBK1785421.1 MFS transporter [Prauserella cavernicola]